MGVKKDTLTDDFNRLTCCKRLANSEEEQKNKNKNKTIALWPL